jgi:hypothetical protein
MQLPTVAAKDPMVSRAENGLARGSEPCSVLPRYHAVGSITDGGFNVLRNRLPDLRRAEESAGGSDQARATRGRHRPAPERGQ